MTIRVFVGTAANGEDAESQAVLEYTLRKHSSLPVEIEWMKMSRDPSSFWYTEPNAPGAWQTQTWATPFSGFRWGIPAFCNYEGKAIYCDSDFIFMSDIAELWNQDFEPGKAVMAKGGENSWRYCLAVWNCEEAQKWLLPIERLRFVPESHQRMMGFFSQNMQIVQQFKGNWNCIDGENYQNLNDPEIKAIHYSDMGSQLHLKYAIPRLKAKGQTHWFDGQVRTHWRIDLQQLFDSLLEEARVNGFSVENYLPNDYYGAYNKQSQAAYTSGHQWSK